MSFGGHLVFGCGTTRINERDAAIAGQDYSWLSTEAPPVPKEKSEAAVADFFRTVSQQK